MSTNDERNDTMSLFQHTRRPTFDELIDLGNFDLDLGYQPVRRATRSMRWFDRLLATVAVGLGIIFGAALVGVIMRLRGLS